MSISQMAWSSDLPQLKPCSQPLPQRDGLSPCGQATMQRRPLIVTNLKDGMENVYRLCLADSSYMCQAFSRRVSSWFRARNNPRYQKFIHKYRRNITKPKCVSKVANAILRWLNPLLLVYHNLSSLIEGMSSVLADGHCRGQFLQIGNLLPIISAG